LRDQHGHENTNLREHLANERTFLSWIRLSVAMIALGFVIARFGIFIAEVIALAAVRSVETDWSVPIGITLVLLGPTFAVLALLRFLTAEREIETGQVARHHGLIYALIVMTVLVGVGLTAYLLVIANTIGRQLRIP